MLTGQQASSTPPPTSTLPEHSSVSAIAPPMTTTLPVHSSVSAIAPPITTVASPAETCYEIPDGQIQCVPARKVKRTSKTTAAVTLDDRETPCVAEDNCGINSLEPVR